MPAKQHQIIAPHKTWADVAGSGEVIETYLGIKRARDNCFVKVFPDFPEAILAAMRDKKLEGSGDLLFYFMHRAMKSMVNGTEEQIKIEATAAQIMEATGKSRRSVINHLNTLIRLGFLKQPRRGVAAYVLPPEYIYRGVLHKLRQKQAQEGAKSAAQVMKEIKAKRPAGEKK